MESDLLRRPRTERTIWSGNASAAVVALHVLPQLMSLSRRPEGWILVDGHKQEHISIGLWRGYVTGLFYARPVASDVALSTSPPFRRLRLPWERPSAFAEPGRAALDVLVEELTASGWQMEEQQAGAAWYALEFIRPPKRSRPRRQKPSSVGENAQRVAGRPLTGPPVAGREPPP
jgi:hypothetical protein